MTSSEPVRTSKYMRYLGLQHYEPGMQYDAHECNMMTAYLR